MSATRMSRAVRLRAREHRAESAAARTCHRRCHDDLTRRDMTQGDYIHDAAQRRWRGARIHDLASAEVAETRWKLLVEVVLIIGWCTAAKTLC